MALLLVGARAAEPVSPLIGATLEQVLAKYGEPKSQIAAGNRFVMFYASERIVLRDRVVVEVEKIAAEPVRRPNPSPAPTTDPTTPAQPAPGPANPVTVPPGAAATTPSTSPEPGVPTVPANSVVNPPLPEPKVGIKLVRPPSANSGRGSTPTPAPAVPEKAPDTPEIPPAPTVVPEPPKPDPAALAAAAESATAAAEAAAKSKRTKAASSAVRRLDFAGGTARDEDSSPTWSYALVAVVALGGGVFLVMRWRQRQAELAATSVENTPVPFRMATPVAPAVAPAPVRPIETKFSNDFVARLDAEKFEALVAAYYSTTGVMAVRANGNAGGPVQIRISWKGEPRPFAGVLCVAQPTVPIEAKSLGDFTAALAKEEIRRGHIVTSGKFAQSARDFAAQNQLTLFPGEAFVEKLNALPESARTEIMRSTNTADSVA